MPTKSDTKNHILDVAEKHFARDGFAGTSLRAIIKDAKVNVAAIAYHFGTKEELYEAVTERFAAPVVVEQLKRLENSLSMDDASIEDVLFAFYEPPLNLIKKLGKKGETLSTFLGRAQTEPEPVYSLVDRHYAACRNKFIEAIERFVPGLTEADYQWRFEFMLSLIVCFLTRHKPVRARYSKDTDWNPADVTSTLIGFCLPGITGSPSKSGINP
ncbi:MAG TPA: TetR/AcrR family transcriptional regulator [Candidatus Melainabacteria bacterium]|jgi:AcrR family transcriptional regulator|nr:TetR/AcrR family transcriptional regulator [Candidatus Melainabacteria bacterium]HIN65325.1 TetR/AcrR family transcriptional regulator [Candidatus Obscuribacterales bacterium]